MTFMMRLCMRWEVQSSKFKKVALMVGLRGYRRGSPDLGAGIRELKNGRAA